MKYWLDPAIRILIRSFNSYPSLFLFHLLSCVSPHSGIWCNGFNNLLSFKHPSVVLFCLIILDAQSNLPSPRNSNCTGIPAGLHGVPQLFLYPHMENAQEVPNGSKQMYLCAQTKINSREPSWMV